MRASLNINVEKTHSMYLEERTFFIIKMEVKN